MADPRVARLSEAQKICLLFVAAGVQSKEISAFTHWTPRTIDQYIYSAKRMLNIPNRREAGRFLLSHINSKELKRLQLKFYPLVMLSKASLPKDEQAKAVKKLAANSEVKAAKKSAADNDAKAATKLAGDGETMAATKQAKRSQSPLRKLPPLGGQRHELDIRSRFSQMVLAALLLAMPSLSLLLIVTFTLKLLR